MANLLGKLKLKYTKTSLPVASPLAILATGGQIFGQFSEKYRFRDIFWEKFCKNSKRKTRTNHKILKLKRIFCSKKLFLMSISGFIFKLVLIQSLLYYILLLRQIASLPADLATGGVLTDRFPPIARSWYTYSYLPNKRRESLNYFY